MSDGGVCPFGESELGLSYVLLIGTVSFWVRSRVCCTVSFWVRGTVCCTVEEGDVISGIGCVWLGSKPGSGSEIEVGSLGELGCGVVDSCWCGGDLA